VAFLLAPIAAGCSDPPSSNNPDTGTDVWNPQPDGGDPDASSDVQQPPIDAGPDPTITPGAKDKILLEGTIVTPDTVIEGQVLVEADKITCVEAGTGCSTKPGAMGATIIQTNGIIAPGLIDTHNHILFDIFNDDDWLPAQVYTNHNQWPMEARYGAMLDVKQCLANDSQGKPAWCAQTTYGTPQGTLRCEMDKWGELKGLIAGTTSIVGLPGTSAACFGSLARSVDMTQNGLPRDKVQTSAIFPPSNPTGVCNNFASNTTDAFLVHVGEGVDAVAKNEWTTLSNSGSGCLLAPETGITHGTAFTATEFAIMGTKGMKLTWSPKSNVALYNATTDIPAALNANVLVALAPDWSMGGSQNMLDEMRFADAWDNKNWQDRLKPKDIVTMSTLNGAKVLAYDDLIGQIKVGLIADIAVFGGDRTRPYESIIAATPRDVRLVMVGGKPLYGDKVLEPAAQTMPACETLDICTKQKFLCVATADTTKKLNQTYADIKGALEKAMTDVDTVSGLQWKFAPVAPIVKCP
jgi:cytosine/adenosine deaminase-related metal-dependent hydrolase